MLFGLVIQLIVYLIIFSILVSNINNNSTVLLQIQENKIKTIYEKEKLIRNAYQWYIEDGLSIVTIPSLADLQSTKHLSGNFNDDNFFSSTFSTNLIDNNGTLEICHDISEEMPRNLYLNHYLGESEGIKPYLQSGDTVCHDYQFRMKTIEVLIYGN